MKKKPYISQIFQQMRVPASAKLDERVHGEIENAVTLAATVPVTPDFTLGQILGLFLKRRSARYTLATSAGLMILIALALTHPAPSAWAMEQAIETLRKYRGLELCGTMAHDGKPIPINLWLRADASGDWVVADLARVGDLATLWTKDNQTYTYVRDDKTVYVEPGITQALNPWPGPTLLALLSAAKDYKAIEGDDPATGRKRVVVTCSLNGMDGPRSLLLEFDVRTKLLVSMKLWQNLGQDGAPYLDLEKILYFEDLPDSTFDFQPPAGTTVTNLPLTVPEAALPVLGDANSGISAAGMTDEQACQKILGQYWTANLGYDFARLRQLAPLSAGLSDEALRKGWDVTGITQVLKIGGIERTGDSKLGPLALVPSWVRSNDGIVTEIWTIIQFRETDHGTSCVIYGQHGYAINVKE